MGVNFNANAEEYGRARKQSDQTIYVFSDVDIPDPVGGEINLVTDLVYEIDKEIMLTDTLVCSDNTIRGDGSVNNEIQWSAGATALRQSGDFQVVIDDLTLEDTDDSCTLLDIDNPSFAPGAAVFLKNGVVLRFWDSLGEVTQTRVNIATTDVINVNGGFSFRNCSQVILDLMFFGFREPNQSPPDWLIRVYDDDALSGPSTRDVNMLGIRTNAGQSQNVDASFFYFEPNIDMRANILVAGCSILGPEANICDPFLLGDESEITNYTDNLDGTITCATPSTGSLANGDWINILRTENYNGGHEVSNVVANTSFDITATYVDNPGRGTWHSGSLDQRDPRLKCRDNIRIPESRSTFAAFQNGNAQETTLGTQDVWEKVEFDGLADGAPLVERFAMCGDGSLAEFIYHGREQLTGSINVQARLRADGGGAALDDYELAWGLNGADPANTFLYTIPDLSGLVTRDFIFNQAFIVSEGDVLSLYVKCTTDARDFLMEDIAIFAQGF